MRRQCIGTLKSLRKRNQVQQEALTPLPGYSVTYQGVRRLVMPGSARSVPVLPVQRRAALTPAATVRSSSRQRRPLQAPAGIPVPRSDTSRSR
jgi:hypothetical protein